MTFQHCAPNFRIFFANTTEQFVKLHAVELKLFSIKISLKFLQDIDNEDENIKVLEMRQKNKNQDLDLTKLLCYKH